MLTSLLRCRLGTFLLAVTCFLTSPDSASAEFNFDLHNHPDGSARPPLYGLRLDNLEDSGGIYTFDFDYTDGTDSAAMTMTVDEVAGTVFISGTVYGGLNEGSGYAAGAARFWNVEFTYDDVNIVQSSGQLVSMTSGDNNGTGMISSDLGTFSLTGFMDPSFIFETGWRMPSGQEDTWTGRGWLNVNGRDHVASQDWLFTAEPSPDTTVVPAPPALALFALGALGLIPVAGRRRKREDV